MQVKNKMKPYENQVTVDNMAGYIFELDNKSKDTENIESLLLRLLEEHASLILNNN